MTAKPPVTDAAETEPVSTELTAAEKAEVLAEARSIARTRIKDLDTQLIDREKQYNEALAELDQQAEEKETEITAARDYYDQAIFLLGEEVYQLRTNDSALVPMYLKLDKAAG